VHGDIEAARRALRLAAVIDGQDHWNGGETVVVQVGDQLDRGDDEQAILEWFVRLADEAFEAGGGFYPLNGNHETMNVSLDFRYVTQGGWRDFEDVAHDPEDPVIAHFEPAQRGRAAAFRPGGVFAMLLARQNTVMVVGRNVFVHGGVLPRHFGLGLRQINAEIQAWMRGETARPAHLNGDDSMVWSRHFSSDTDASDCALLTEVLDLAGADRMVVAHTVQPGGINSACNDRVWRVDVGLAEHYGGTAQVLEVVDNTVTVLR
jgi:hypothetical protein